MESKSADVGHHLTALRAHERETRRLLHTGKTAIIQWRKSRIEGHAVRAFVALLTVLGAS